MKTLDFGFCPIGEKRMLPLTVKNVSVIKCICTALKSIHNINFLVSPTRCAINPSETGILNIEYAPKYSLASLKEQGKNINKKNGKSNNEENIDIPNVVHGDVQIIHLEIGNST